MERSESDSSDSVNHAADVLAHFGVLGMHWGVRKREASATKDQTPVSIHIKRGQKIKTSGGDNQPPTEDAKKAAAYQQIANKNGVQSLTNPEIQHLLNRISLEQKYSKLQSELHPQSKGRAFIQGLIKTEGSSLLSGKKGPIALLIAGILGSKGSTTVKALDAAVAAKGAKAALKYAAKHRR